MNTSSIILRYECWESKANTLLFTYIEDSRIYINIHEWRWFPLDMERNHFVQCKSVGCRISDVAAVVWHSKIMAFRIVQLSEGVWCDRRISERHQRNYASLSAWLKRMTRRLTSTRRFKCMDWQAVTAPKNQRRYNRAVKKKQIADLSHRLTNKCRNEV